MRPLRREILTELNFLSTMQQNLTRLAFSAFFILFAGSLVFAQSDDSTTNKNLLPSASDMFSSLVGGDKKTSLTDTIKDIMSTSQTEILTENTEDTVKSVIEGSLVVEEQIPEINKEIVEAIDPKTKRYPPRLSLDFKEFPLRKIARTEWTDYPIGFDSNDHGRARRFEIDHYDARQVSARIRGRLGEQGLQIDFEGRKALLHGSVSSEHKRDLAELMVRLEPGIEEIENVLVVAP